MTDVHDIIDAVEGSDEFREFRARHPHPYLAHLFCYAKSGSAPVEIGYYSERDDHIVVFDTKPVRARPPEGAFKEEGVIAPLDLASVGIGLAQARELAAARMRERYPAHPVQQEICILQQGDGPVWNLTIVTATLNLVTMRLDARDGAVLSDELRNIMDMQQK